MKKEPGTAYMGPAANWTSTRPVQYSASALEPKSAAPTIHITANTTTTGSSKNRS
jgi:hypothetical protein